MLRITIFWGLYWGPLILGNYQVCWVSQRGSGFKELGKQTHLKPMATEEDNYVWELDMSVPPQMSYSLNSLKGGYIGDDIGDYYRGY